MMDDADLTRLREVAEVAAGEVVRLCDQRERFRMTIPADPGRDSDLILMAACKGLEDALDHIAAMTARAETAEARLADVWDEAAEATAEWCAAYAHGNNGPPDPPANPYHAAALAAPAQTEGDES